MSTIDNILALNALHETETSALTHEQLENMLSTAFHWTASMDGQDGYIIALDQASASEGINFQWFKTRYSHFVYVDRIVVAQHARGRGLARSFYDILIAKARKAGHKHLFCEINVDPPNPGSLAFHKVMGFTEIGTAQITPYKSVSYHALGV